MLDHLVLYSRTQIYQRTLKCHHDSQPSPPSESLSDPSRIDSGSSFPTFPDLPVSVATPPVISGVHTGPQPVLLAHTDDEDDADDAMCSSEWACSEWSTVPPSYRTRRSEPDLTDYQSPPLPPLPSSFPPPSADFLGSSQRRDLAAFRVRRRTAEAGDTSPVTRSSSSSKEHAAPFTSACCISRRADSSLRVRDRG